MNIGKLVLLSVGILTAACGADSPVDQPEPTPTSQPPPAATAPSPAGLPMSVSDAIKRAEDGPVIVEGFLFFTPDGALVAEHLLESYPPQPGGTTLSVIGVGQETYATQTAGGVTWTERPVEIAGTLEGGTLYVETEGV